MRRPVRSCCIMQAKTFLQPLLIKHITMISADSTPDHGYTINQYINQIDYMECIPYNRKWYHCNEFVPVWILTQFCRLRLNYISNSPAFKTRYQQGQVQRYDMKRSIVVFSLLCIEWFMMSECWHDKLCVKTWRDVRSSTSDAKAVHYKRSMLLERRLLRSSCCSGVLHMKHVYAPKKLLFIFIPQKI